MGCQYISDVSAGLRQLLWMSPGCARQTEYRRRSLTPGPTGKPRRGSPTTRLMGHQMGYCQSTATWTMEEKISKSTRTAFTHMPLKAIRAAGETPPLRTSKRRTDTYPAGLPPRPGKIKAVRSYRHRSLEVWGRCGGRFLATPGSKGPESACPGGARESVKLRGLRHLIKTRLPRRRGVNQRRKAPSAASMARFGGCVVL